MVTFAERFMFHDQPPAQQLAEVFYYGCRNPMLHSFSLHNHLYRMTLVPEMPYGNAIWTAKAPDQSISYLVSVGGLYHTYLTAIARYKSALESDASLQASP